MAVRKIIEKFFSNFGMYLNISTLRPENRYTTLDIGTWEPYFGGPPILEKYNSAQSKIDGGWSDNILKQLRYWNLVQCAQDVDLYQPKLDSLMFLASVCLMVVILC